MPESSSSDSIGAPAANPTAQHRHRVRQAGLGSKDGQVRLEKVQHGRQKLRENTDSTTGSAPTKDKEDEVTVQTRWLRLQLRKDIGEDILGALKTHEQGIQDTLSAMLGELKFIENRLSEEMTLIKRVAKQGHEQIVEVADMLAASQNTLQSSMAKLNLAATQRDDGGELGEMFESHDDAMCEGALSVVPVAHRTVSPGQKTTAVHPGKPSPRSPQDAGREIAAAAASSMIAGKADKRKQNEEPSHAPFLEAIITHPAFDALCAGIIMLNAVHIAVSSELGIRHALAHPGQGPMESNPTLVFTSYAFFAFYSCELILKLFVFRLGYFTNAEAQWNIFDLFLVVTSFYSIVADAVIGSGGVNMGWMRLLKLMKMLKMLRVIRVMSFFKELRMLIHAVQGSLGMLMWSMAMIASVLFVFGICFLQAVSGLLTSATDDVDVETYASIQKDWGSLSASMVTLLAAMTGGCEWRAVAAPLQSAGLMYHLLFILYIGFACLSIMNVLTGIFVDKAVKIATQDYETVIAEIMAHDAELQSKLYGVFYDMDEDGDDKVTHEDLELALEDQHTRAYFKAFEIEPNDARRLFKMLAPGQGDAVTIEDFCSGLMHVKGPAKSLDMVCVGYDAKKMILGMGVLQNFVEEQFNHMHDFHNKHLAAAGKKRTA